MLEYLVWVKVFGSWIFAGAQPTVYRLLCCVNTFDCMPIRIECRQI